MDALNIAQSGMAANQKSMEVTGNNIANINTPGYSKQTAVINSLPAIESGGLSFGQGVDIEEIAREDDMFINNRIMRASEENGKASAKSTPLAEIEQIFNLEEDNLAIKIEEFFASWQDLTTNPGGGVERELVIQRGKQLVSTFDNVYNKLDTVRRNINDSLHSEIKNVNTKLKKVAELNTTIANFETIGAKAHRALDERDILLQELSQKLGVTSFKGENNTVSVILPNGQVLVQGQEAYQLKEDNSDIFVDTGNVKFNINQKDVGGQFQGLIEVRDDFIPKVESQVDTLRYDLVTQVNAQHQKGEGLDGETGREFFSKVRVVYNDGGLNGPGAIVDDNINNGTTNIWIKNGSDSQTINFNSLDDINGDGQLSLEEIRDTINQKQNIGVQASIWRKDKGDYRLSFISKDKTKEVEEIDSSNLSSIDFNNIKVQNDNAYQMEIAITDLSEVAAGFSDAPGDNRNAQEMADLAIQNKVNQKFTFLEYYGKISGEVGLEVNQNEMLKSISQDNLVQLQNRREAKEGVSLKQSMIDLIKFQKGFEAAARHMSVVDQMLETLLAIKR